MIRFTSRPNIKYLVQLIIWSFIRDVETEIIDKIFVFDIDLIYTLLMFLGEFSFGAITYLYQKQFLEKKLNENKSAGKSVKLITNNQIKIYDSKCKIYLLIFFASLFDFIEFILCTYLLIKFFKYSVSFQKRIGGILIILDAIFYRYLLKLQIFKHQIFSLIIISICLTIILITEFIFQDVDIFLKYSDFILLIFFLLIYQFFNSLLDLTEKYLFEYDYFNPFKVLMLEGFFGFVLSFIYSIYINPIPSIIKCYYDNSGKFVYLVLLLILYMILSGFKNAFRVLTNKIYSPMAATLAEYLYNPLYIILTLIVKNDFISNKKRNYFYFSINLFLTIIISFSGCIYNEFVILFCYELNYETHQEISLRAALIKADQELYRISDVDDDGNSTL